jgi:gamma-glutamyltranspeptidase/glutathione hydrolase
MTVSLDRRQFLGQAAGAFALAGSPQPISGLVTGQAEGAEAGHTVFAAGGNAVDAIVSAALVAGVVALPSTGLAGYGGHAVVARPDGTVSAIDFNSAAPAAAKPDMFSADERGVVKGRMNADGWLAAGVPGVFAGLQLLLDKFGRMKFPDLVKAAVRFAADGFPVKKPLAAAIKAHAVRFARDPGSARLYLRNGEPLAEGDTFRNPDLASLLRRLADGGRADAFYSGDIANRVAASFKAYGGLVTAADLAAYRAVEVKALALDWKGYTIHTPPPTAGGLTVLQAIATLKALGWSVPEFEDPANDQARVEALRVAWDDRLRLLGDPKFTDVPVEKLLSEDYATATAERVRAAVRMKRPVEARSDGRPAGGTIHLCAADPSGLTVALTFTHGEGFGSGVTIDGLGLTLGHGMSRFDPRPGRPNSIAAGKRPLHNMCPTVVLKGGKPMLAVGATGGRRIPNTVFDVLTYRLGEGWTLAEAVKAPRVHTEGDLNLTLEAGWSPSVVDHFRKVGYAVKAGPGASLNAIERDAATGELRSAAR